MLNFTFKLFLNFKLAAWLDTALKETKLRSRVSEELLFWFDIGILQEFSVSESFIF